MRALEPSAPTRSRDPVPLLRLERARAPGKARLAALVPAGVPRRGRHDNPTLRLPLPRRPRGLVRRRAARTLSRPAPLRALLVRRGLPLALAELDLDEHADLLDLDDPVVLRRERLRPSQVATRQRAVTQPQARELHDSIRTRRSALVVDYEALWANVTLFDRAALMLRTRVFARSRRRSCRRGSSRLFRHAPRLAGAADTQREVRRAQQEADPLVTCRRAPSRAPRARRATGTKPS